MGGRTLPAGSPGAMQGATLPGRGGVARGGAVNAAQSFVHRKLSWGPPPWADLEPQASGPRWGQPLPRPPRWRALAGRYGLVPPHGVAVGDAQCDGRGRPSGPSQARPLASRGRGHRGG